MSQRSPGARSPRGWRPTSSAWEGILPDRVLITGAAGFVGTALSRHLVTKQGSDEAVLVRGATRAAGVMLPVGVERVVVGDLANGVDAGLLLDGVTHVVHLAGRAHVMKDRAADAVAEYRRVNIDATMHLAQAAASRGVGRFVFVSSVKANGEFTSAGERFTERIIRRTTDPYGLSKLEAEEALLDLSAKSGMAVTIIRPPLVYGPGVRANFAALMRAVERGLPLPLGAIDNSRSLIGLDNLVHFIEVCLRHPAAAGAAFLVSDGNDLSTPSLIRKLADALDVHARLFSMPAPLLLGLATLTGRKEAVRRLFDSLEVDISKARTQLGWTPPFTVDQQLRRIVSARQANRRVPQ